MMIDRTFVAEEQSMLTRLREQEAKTSGEQENFVKIIIVYRLIIEFNGILISYLQKNLNEKKSHCFLKLKLNQQRVIKHQRHYQIYQLNKN